MTNVGIRPTVSRENTVSVESHLLDFSGNLYGRLLCLEFYDYLRPEQRFASKEALAAQIAADGEHSRRIMEERQ